MTGAVQRANPFAASADDELPDLSEFKPTPRSARPKVDKAATRAMAERSGFTSREPAAPVSVAAPAQPDPAPSRAIRRRVTGRNRQLNLKVTDAAAERFYALTERHRLGLGEAFEEAVALLEAKLGA